MRLPLREDAFAPRFGFAPREKALLEAVSNAAFGEIIGCHFDQNLVAREDTDSVLAHTSSGVSDNFMLVLKFNPESCVRQQFADYTRKL
jgi:hypothetical protein